MKDQRLYAKLTLDSPVTAATDDIDAALAAAVEKQTPEQREALIARGKEISESGKYWPPAQPYVPYVPPVFADALALDRAHRQKMKRALG